MKNGETIDAEKFKKINNKVSGEKRSFLNWLNELPIELKKRAEKIGIKRLETIRSFGNKFYFSEEGLSELSEELEKKSEEDTLEFVKKLSLNDLEQVDKIEAMKLFVATKKIIYQESTDEK